MKKWMFLSMVLVALPAALMAQDDDMYFASDKSVKTTQQKPVRVSENTYYSGSSRSIDEYNRRYGSGYEVLPADTGDVISFAPVAGVYPDSVSDFQMTRQMQRWDDYVPTTAYWEGYAQGQRDSWGWHSPWYYSAYYPWYDSWYYDPWYYDSWYYGWHRPWYGGYYGWGWGYPYYGWYGGWYHHSWGHHHVYYANRQPGTIDRYGRTSGGFTGARSSMANNSRGTSVRNNSRPTTGSNVRNTGTVRVNSNVSGSGNFTGNRSNSSYNNRNSNAGSYNNSRNNTSSSGSYNSGGGSFSGGRSGGGSMGGGGGRSGGSRR